MKMEGLFSKAATSILHCRAVEHRMLIGRDFEGSSHIFIEVLSYHCLEGLRKTTKILNQGDQCPSKIMKQVPPKYKFRALHLEQSVRC